MIDLDAFKGFTPGPWEYGYLDRNGQRVVRQEHIEICTCWHHSVGSIEIEMGNNARLIAAAPDLLALAREQRAEIERLRAALKPFARADCAVGEEPGPFRFETGTGFVLIQRKDLRRASEALNDQFRGEEG